MSQILVWKCDQTGKLFEDKNKYKGHLSKLARAEGMRQFSEVLQGERRTVDYVA